MNVKFYSSPLGEELAVMPRTEFEYLISRLKAAEDAASTLRLLSSGIFTDIDNENMTADNPNSEAGVAQGDFQLTKTQVD